MARLWDVLFKWGPPVHYFALCAALLAIEAVVGAVIILRVKCAAFARGNAQRAAVTPPPAACPADTEIDWTAYMQEVDGWAVDGHTDYTALRGDTGPLVYPAGFLYLYRGLQLIVGDRGRGPAALRTAQWLFLGLYLCVQALAMRVCVQTRETRPLL